MSHLTHATIDTNLPTVTIDIVRLVTMPVTRMPSTRKLTADPFADALRKAADATADRRVRAWLLKLLDDERPVSRGKAPKRRQRCKQCSSSTP
jgi:hypothetical protein